MRFDLDHEKRRKQQLNLLYGRSKAEVEEEKRLIAELNKIEARRKDREKKKQDLQKLISQVRVGPYLKGCSAGRKSNSGHPRRKRTLFH